MTMKTPLFSLHWFGLAVAGLLAALLAGGQTQTLAHDAVNKSGPIALDQLGAAAGKQYQGDGLSVTATAESARLRCMFQRLEGQVTREGLWLTCTAGDSKGERFRVVAVAVGRAAGQRSAAVCEAPAAALRDRSTRCGWVCDHSRAPLVRTGVVAVAGQIARFIRPGLTEEYSVSVDGVRQDFVVGQRPGGEGPLRVELGVAGAKAEQLVKGAWLVLEGAGRALAYSRLRVVDAQGQELAARLEVATATRLAVVVDDAAAAYPVRIDPTFSDADWMSLGGIAGTDGEVLAAVADGSGNVYIGGYFTVVGDVIANHIAKWNGSEWSALGSGMGGADGPQVWDYPRVYALAVSGTDLFAGGDFTTAGNKASGYAAKANVSAAGGRCGSLAHSLATGFSFTFSDGTAGQPYRIQTSPLLALDSWSDFTNFTYTGPIVINDPSAVVAPKIFYRAVTP